ncbi:MAG: Maf family protein [Brevinema sp.]
MKNIILASGSVGRKELFAEYFETFKVVVSGAEEEDLASLPVKKMVQALAERKAKIVARDYDNDFVCAFDTMVECHGSVIGKPKNKIDAKRILSYLINKEQTVWTGYAIIYQGHLFSGTESATLLLTMDHQSLDRYISEHPVTTFAGGYAIQKQDTNVIIKSGTLDTIIGAPMSLVTEFIKKHR